MFSGKCTVKNVQILCVTCKMLFCFIRSLFCNTVFPSPHRNSVSAASPHVFICDRSFPFIAVWPHYFAGFLDIFFFLLCRTSQNMFFFFFVRLKTRRIAPYHCLDFKCGTNLFAIHFNISNIVLKHRRHVDFRKLVFTENDEEARFPTSTIADNHQLLPYGRHICRGHKQSCWSWRRKGQN